MCLFNDSLLKNRLEPSHRGRIFSTLAASFLCYLYRMTEERMPKRMFQVDEGKRKATGKVVDTDSIEQDLRRPGVREW